MLTPYGPGVIYHYTPLLIQIQRGRIGVLLDKPVHESRRRLEYFFLHEVQSVTVSPQHLLRKVFYGKTQKEVQDKVNEALYQQQKGMLITAPNEPLKVYLERWLEVVCMPPNLRVSTYVKYKKTINTYIIPAIGRVPLQKLEPLHVKRLYNNQLKRGLSPKMVVEIHGLLHKALDKA